MNLAYDIVCGMQVNPQSALHAEHDGQRYYFCCDGCRGAFLRSPEYHLEVWAEEHPGQGPTPAE